MTETASFRRALPVSTRRSAPACNANTHARKHTNTTQTQNDNNNQATRRVLGVLLREIDGFEQAGARSVVIGATNRAADLDAALLSRFAMSLTFGLPDAPTRREILARYAKQLGDGEARALADRTRGFAGRDLRDACEQAERRWAAKIIRGEAPEGSLPPLSEYLAAVDARAAAKRVGAGGGGGAGGFGGGGFGVGGFGGLLPPRVRPGGDGGAAAA